MRSPCVEGFKNEGTEPPMSGSDLLITIKQTKCSERFLDCHKKDRKQLFSLRTFESRTDGNLFTVKQAERITKSCVQS